MAAMALRLDRRLAKPGVYALHAGGRTVAPGDLAAARRVAAHAVAIGGMLMAALAGLLRLPA